MRAKMMLWGLGGVVLLALAAAPFVLMPGPVAAPMQPVPAIAEAEQAAIIAAMRPPKRPDRPVIAIATVNAGTEVSDFLSAYGVLKRADVADVIVVAEKDERVKLYPGLATDPQSTMAAFDAQYPEGADYVVVPAMDPGTDPVMAEWLAAQHEKGAIVVSICNGGRMVGTAGLLNGRRATTHWSAVGELQGKYPTMEWVPDRRYVVDDRLVSATGITANIPVTLAMVEAIGGREAAARTAAELGVEHWDARHRSSDFELTTEHKKTFVRNFVSLWDKETLGIPLADGVDEVALGFVVDAYLRTGLATAVTMSEAGAPVTSAHGLTIYTDRDSNAGGVDGMLAAPPSESPVRVLEPVLEDIRARYGAPTAAVVALVMEYPWTQQ